MYLRIFKIYTNDKALGFGSKSSNLLNLYDLLLSPSRLSGREDYLGFSCLRLCSIDKTRRHVVMEAIVGWMWPIQK